MAFTLSGIYTAEVILNRGSAFKFKGRDGLLGKVKCREYICTPIQYFKIPHNVAS